MYAFLSLQFELPDPLIFFKHFFSFLIKNIKSKGTKLLNFKGCFMVLMNIPCNYFELMGVLEYLKCFFEISLCSLSTPSIFKYNQIIFSGFECKKCDVSHAVIEIPSDASLAETVEILSKNKILSAPIRNVEAPEDASWMDKYIGIVEFAGIAMWLLSQVCNHALEHI